ncbi:MAG: zinc ABC transporter substrate-binding protein [Thermoguttaceae bacterium]|nr:zinc ABC transporter substrate-binding protein [Thermoguttaceae bacterium]MDW8079305.1 zinc ABC transporter substrate-binding protein [Thermoguttaceae bacterium]
MKDHKSGHKSAINQHATLGDRIAAAFLIALPLLIFACTVGCSQMESGVPTPGRPGNKLRVAVVATPYRWLLHQIAGERVDIVTLGEGAICSEAYQPTDAEVSRVLSCHLLFRVGLPFEQSPWFQSLLTHPSIRVVDLRESVLSTGLLSQHGATSQAAKENSLVVDEVAHSSHPQEKANGSAAEVHEEHHGAKTDGDPHLHGHNHNHSHEADPHIWLEPNLLVAQVATIAHELCRIDPQHASLYTENSRKLEDRLKRLDAELASKLAGVKGRRVLVFHPGWHYFLSRYGLAQVAVEKEGKLPSDAELTRLRKELREAGAKAIVIESADPGHPARAFAETIGLKTIVISPIGENIEQTLREFSDFALAYAF